MIDLNADVGEGYDDLALMPFVSSVNIACGGHAGDERTMAETVQAAKRFGVAIGAHPSYPDREHFGRREIAISLADLEAAIRDQIRALLAIGHVAGASVRHVKPHGALYNVAARDASTARAIGRAVRDVDRRLTVVGLAGSRLVEVARELGLRADGEAFADRRYAADGSLLPRSDARALIREPAEAADQALSIARDRVVRAADGARLAVVADTLCVHGDTPGAAEIAHRVRDRLLEAGITIGRP
jgi:5-oxoprolinase (ATP-hydrolysing) subunit A